ncbi:MAG TPA: hypothetical protein IAB46_11840 [Candidatus Scybalocola faecigallinarum]|uniref:Autoinducer 2 import system permease protein LsrD n=1 Tax=Candidatus Scybalocola faecigallinarum TaxID=2840941 RepID=A0A9D1F631_9FIRM|nr:hypothetical protein [Candidatus Scybalocola faecigallinarum]
MKKNKFLDFIKRFFLTILFPLVIYVVMYIIVKSKGVTYFGLTVDMWRTVLVETSMTSVAALAIWTQIKNGRFDFSGGATMVLAAILAGNLAIDFKLSPVIYLILCIVFGAALSTFTGLIYICGRLPIMICTIGAALLYESITYLVYDAEGLNMMSNTRLTIFGRMPYILVILGIALAFFLVYCYLTVPGRRSKLLSNNQQASVNIGIKENKNVIQTFFMCGLLLGCAAAIYGSNNTVAPQSGLSTADTLFSNIIPAYMGMFVGAASVDALGVILASLGMAILNYGLSCIGLGAGGWQSIIIGTFMLAFYTLTAQWPRWKESYYRRKRLKAERCAS